MRLDHVSYVASHDQISDVVNRIGSQIGTAFVDGGIHPKFGTRNFTAPLLNGQYIEIVCPLDHPATDATPFGMAVKQKALDGGGWFAWVVSTDDIQEFEIKLDRKAIEGSRRMPSGTNLKWLQIGVLSTLNEPSKPFFVQWLVNEHPSKTSEPVAAIHNIYFNSVKTEVNDWLKIDVDRILGTIESEWELSPNNLLHNGITKIQFKVNNSYISIE